MKISEIISKLEAWHAPLDHPEHTADTVKSGDADKECTGIAITCYASVNVIRKAAEQNCNLLIVHENVFYSAEDGTDWLEGNKVYEAKRKLLNDTGIVIWRDHDHIHGPGGPMAKVHTEIDYIYYGIMQELGWEPYLIGERTKPLLFEIPPRTVEQLTREFLDKFELTGARIVGNKNDVVSRVFICEHMWGRPKDAEAVAGAEDFDVMIPLEIMDWTLSEYVRDAAQLGMGKAVIEMGQFNTEELGMKYMLKWLPEVIGSGVPIQFIQSGDSFSYIVK